MTKILKIDHALYEVDTERRTYKYCGRNNDWRDLSKADNERNKLSIDGFVRTFPDGRRKIFKFKP